MILFLLNNKLYKIKILISKYFRFYLKKLKNFKDFLKIENCVLEIKFNSWFCKIAFQIYN